MNAVSMMTQTMALRRILDVNSTDTSFPSTIPIIAPIGLLPPLTIAMGYGGAQAQNFVKVLPISVGNDDTTYLIRLWVWHLMGSGTDTSGGAVQLWIPHLIFEGTCTAGTTVGVAGTAVLATERFADTIVAATAYATLPSVEVVSPADNTPAHILVDMKGAQMLGATFNRNSSATSCNALFTNY